MVNGRHGVKQEAASSILVQLVHWLIDGFQGLRRAYRVEQGEVIVHDGLVDLTILLVPREIDVVDAEEERKQGIR